MAVESVNQSSNPLLANIAAQQARDARASQQATQRSAEPPKEQRVEPPKQETPKPVVNAEGQTTGSRINVTA